ncbi:MAG: biotin synthase BioB [Deltaproteobacteria bacterium]|jgi:biotin synthase|nr:biotin synthase BioB [Deltaproteobacteria bacterium]MBT6436094.1 biotin synthase BioB [Deltaproteobacteria bacterium]
MTADIRHDWTLEEVHSIYNQPLLDLVHQASDVHRKFHQTDDIQKCTLVSIKTGGCPEDCGYCSQSVHHEADLTREPLMGVDVIRQKAKQARVAGATRLCMGAAWRSAKKGKSFETVLEMVKAVNAEGLESCVTLGMLNREQAEQLKEAGLTTYNHNLDTSRDYYPKVITSRTYDDRLETLQHVRDVGLGMCCGGIIGMGESADDRISLLHTLATFEKHPDSLPVNMLVPVKGTPMENTPLVDPLELVRSIATARILCPEARVRLSAGRKSLSQEGQTLCFLAGANSIFYGEQLLTTPNNAEDEDVQLFASLGI